jgi:hypothetical protein
VLCVVVGVLVVDDDGHDFEDLDLDGDGDLHLDGDTLR